MTVNINPLMTEVEKNNRKLYIFLVFLDLKSEGQAPTGEAKVYLDDEISTGTNNKRK